MFENQVTVGSRILLPRKVTFLAATGQDLAGDKTVQAVAGTIVSLARAFELTTVAEGVEREEKPALLKDLKCEQSQGYLHSPPLPLEAFETLLARSAPPSREAVSAVGTPSPSTAGDRSGRGSPILRADARPGR